MKIIGILAASLTLTSGFAQAQASRTSNDLADYFGFAGMEIVPIDANAGPLAAADMNADGHTDLIAINNYKSRIEIHYQKRASGLADEEPASQDLRVNELADNTRFRRQEISVSHRIGSILAHDFDEDGLMDLIYGGQPAAIVFVRQTEPGIFEVERRHRTPDLMTNKDSLRVADIVGDARQELLALIDGEIRIWTIDGASLDHQTDLPSAAAFTACFVEDFDGNGRLDVVGVSPDDPAPVRLWLANEESGMGAIGAQLRFEMPPVREFEPFRLPDDPAARMVIIERTSKRFAFYTLEPETVAQHGDRDAAMIVTGFTDPESRERDVAVVDADGDGALDLLATDRESSAVALYRQLPGRGLQLVEEAPSYAELVFIAAGNVDEDAEAELFVLSEEEGVVGRADLEGSVIPYPQALSIPDGLTPVAMNLVRLHDGHAVVVVLKDGRDYSAQVMRMDGASELIEVGSLSRSPDTVVAIDADQDSLTDLLLLTRDKPMIMLRAEPDQTDAESDDAPGYTLLESDDMGQFGLVQAASGANTTVVDIDGDGGEELLIADRNFIRAVKYVPNPEPGVSAGWQVVRQINAANAESSLVGIAILNGRIVAADKDNERLILFARDDSTSSGWREQEALNVHGFELNDIFAGSFAGDDQPSILAISDDAFAVVRLAGDRLELREFASWRTDEERRWQHELTSGDVNSDGFIDLISLDAGEQMLEIFTFSEAQRLLYATGFQVFESKIFSGGEPREFQPSQSLIADVTGDGAGDIILLAHDRVLIYPQMTEADVE